MISINFRLKRPDAVRTTVLVMDVSLSGHRIRRSTGLSVSPRDWNKRSQRVQQSAPEASVVNRIIDAMCDHLRGFEADTLLSGRNLTSLEIDRAIDTVLERSKTSKERSTSDLPDIPRTVIDALDSWIETHRAERRPSTIRVRLTLRDHISNFNEFRGKRDQRLADTHRDWIDAFVSFLREEKGMLDSAIWKYARAYRTVAHWAEKKGIPVGDGHKNLSSSRFHLKPAHSTRLSADELHAIQEVDLADRPGLDNVRNLFVLQCCLGTRFSDLIRIAADPGSFVDTDVVRLRTRKTDTAVVIPLLPMAKTILALGTDLRPISNQKYNAMIKIVAERAGLVERSTVTRWYGGRRQEEKVRICDLLSSHAAKRTFVSLMTTAGVRTETIMKITGNTRSTIDSYVHLNESEVEAEVLGKATELF